MLDWVALRRRKRKGGGKQRCGLRLWRAQKVWWMRGGSGVRRLTGGYGSRLHYHIGSTLNLSTMAEVKLLVDIYSKIRYCRNIISCYLNRICPRHVTNSSECSKVSGKYNCIIVKY